MAFLDRNILIGFGAGVLVGILGYKMVSAHKDEIEAKLQQLGVGTGGCGCNDGEGNGSDAGGLTIEDLEAQKERLEDLIAEQKQKAAGNGTNA